MRSLAKLMLTAFGVAVIAFSLQPAADAAGDAAFVGALARQAHERDGAHEDDREQDDERVDDRAAAQPLLPQPSRLQVGREGEEDEEDGDELER